MAPRPAFTGPYLCALSAHEVVGLAVILAGARVNIAVTF